MDLKMTDYKLAVEARKKRAEARKTTVFMRGWGVGAFVAPPLKGGALQKIATRAKLRGSASLLPLGTACRLRFDLKAP